MRKQHNKGGKSLLENPKPSAAWNTKGLIDLEFMNPQPEEYELIHVDMRAFGLKDAGNGLLHENIFLGIDSPGIKEKILQPTACAPTTGRSQRERPSHQAGSPMDFEAVRVNHRRYPT